MTQCESSAVDPFCRRPPIMTSNDCTAVEAWYAHAPRAHKRPLHSCHASETRTGPVETVVNRPHAWSTTRLVEPRSNADHERDRGRIVRRARFLSRNDANSFFVRNSLHEDSRAAVSIVNPRSLARAHAMHNLRGSRESTEARVASRERHFQHDLAHRFVRATSSARAMHIVRPEDREAAGRQRDPITGPFEKRHILQVVVRHRLLHELA